MFSIQIVSTISASNISESHILISSAQSLGGVIDIGELVGAHSMRTLSENEGGIFLKTLTVVVHLQPDLVSVHCSQIHGGELGGSKGDSFDQTSNHLELVVPFSSVGVVLSLVLIPGLLVTCSHCQDELVHKVKQESFLPNLQMGPISDWAYSGG